MFNLSAVAKMGPATKIWLNRAGSLLGLLGVLFVAERLYVYRSELSFAGWHGKHYVALGTLCCCYGLINISLAYGWHSLLTYLKFPQPFRWTFRTYAITQLAKYVPGNVFQFAGRQVMGAAVGIPHNVLIKSSVLEIILLTIAASSFTPIFAYRFAPSLSEIMVLGIFSISFLIIGIITVTWAPKALVRAACGYVVQVLISSLIFVGVFILAGGSISSSFNLCIIMAGFVLSWLVGLLTPGASAGLGVRESALVFLLSDVATPSIIITAAVLGRIVTTTGDVLFFWCGKFVR